MQVVFRKLNIKNFKGLENRSLTFKEGTNFVSGPNGSGKSTVVDAIFWLLFGKNQENRKTFSYTPIMLDGSLKEIEDTTVELELDINDKTHMLTRTVKKSKSSMFIDGIPKKMIEFDTFVSNNMFSPDDFKMFVNPTYFSGTLPWKEQRNLLMKYFDMPEKSEVLPFMERAKAGKLFLEEIEVNEPEEIIDKYELELKTLKKKREKYSNQIELLDSEIEDFQEDSDIELLKERRQSLHSEMDDVVALQKEMQSVIKHNASQKLKIERLENDIEVLQMKIEAAQENRPNPVLAEVKDEINKAMKDKERLLADYKRLKNDLENIDESCPFCKQELPEEQIGLVKSNLLDSIRINVEKGKKLKGEIQQLELKLAEESKVPYITGNVDERLTILIDEKSKALMGLRATPLLKMVKEVPDITKIRQKYEKLNDYIGRFDAIEKAKERKASLIEELRATTARGEEVDKCIKDAGKYIYYRTKIIVDGVNSKFETISLKLFKELKGGKVEETFEITRKGVPYKDDNSAGKIIAGFELLEFLKKSMDINVPVVIDNFERYPGISIEEIKSQLVLARATEGKTDQIGSFEVTYG